jgi:hypothetical protein
MSRTIMIPGTLTSSATSRSPRRRPSRRQACRNQPTTCRVSSGANSPCPFDITFTCTGEVTITTYYDNTGTPIRQSIHGALVHTIFSA